MYISFMFLLAFQIEKNILDTYLVCNLQISHFYLYKKNMIERVLIILRYFKYNNTDKILQDACCTTWCPYHLWFTS